MQKLVPCPLPTSSSRFWNLFALFCNLLFREMYFFVGIYFVISQFWPFRECECDSIRNPYRCNWATDLSTVKQTLEKGSWKQYTCKKKPWKVERKKFKVLLTTVFNVYYISRCTTRYNKKKNRPYYIFHFLQSYAVLL